MSDGGIRYSNLKSLLNYFLKIFKGNLMKVENGQISGMFGQYLNRMLVDPREEKR